MNADEFRKLSHEEKIARADEWWRDVRPALIDEAMAQGMPSSLIEYHDAGGAADFSFHDGVESSRSALEQCIAQHFETLPGYNNGPVFEIAFDREALTQIEPTALTRSEFYGSCLDPETGRLCNLTGSYGLSRPGEARGEFAHAFARSPYSVGLSPARLQEIFDEIDTLMFPRESGFEICDWGHPSLGAVSNYFDAGLEWWGVYLFTVSYPADRRVTVISASSTD